jgi:hypothetical protein
MRNFGDSLVYRPQHRQVGGNKEHISNPGEETYCKASSWKTEKEMGG